MLPSLHKFPSRNNNAKYLIPDHANMDIQVSKNDNTSHTIKVTAQTKDKRNFSVQSFVVSRDEGVPSCEIVGNELLFSIDETDAGIIFSTGNTRYIGLAGK